MTQELIHAEDIGLFPLNKLESAALDKFYYKSPCTVPSGVGQATILKFMSRRWIIRSESKEDYAEPRYRITPYGVDAWKRQGKAVAEGKVRLSGREKAQRKVDAVRGKKEA